MIEAARPTPSPGFSAPAMSLRHAGRETAGALIAASADVALVIDGGGVILDVAFSEADLANEAYRDWIGRRWVDTVTAEGRQKIENWLRDATQRSPTRWRQVNHPAAGSRHPGALSRDPLWRRRADSRCRPRSSSACGSAATAGRDATGDGARIYTHPERGKALPTAVSALL